MEEEQPTKRAYKKLRERMTTPITESDITDQPNQVDRGVSHAAAEAVEVVIETRLETEPLFPDAPTANIAADTLPSPPQTIEEMRSALAKREQQIGAIQRLGRTL